jgi:hypothetical protein
MGYGLRLRTYSLTLGSAFDFFVPDRDMPTDKSPRGYNIGRDILTTPRGNSYLYDKFRKKQWKLTFEDITTLTKNSLEHIESGWLGSRQITMVYWGTSVIGTVETPGSMATAGQLWGTGYVTIDKIPEEAALDQWNLSLTIDEFGPDQSFTP